MLVYLRNGNSSTLFLACVGRGGQVLEAWWSPSDATKEKKEQRRAKLKIKGCLPAARQLASHWRATASSQSQLAHQWPVVSGISPVARQPASNWRERLERLENTTWHTFRAVFGGLKSLKNLGISWESSGEAWRDLGILHLWLYLSPSSSYLFNEPLHSFRVCFIYIYV